MITKHKINTIILAAGKGTRMKSTMLKVLHEVAGKPIVAHVIDAVEPLTTKLFMVIGHQADAIKKKLNNNNIHYVKQTEQLGTGHAVQQVIPHLSDTPSYTLILAGDSPLIEASSLNSLVEAHITSKAKATILSTDMANPTGYGRIIRDKNNTVVGIKEHKDCSSNEKSIKEINSGIYIFETAILTQYIKEITTNNAQKEYYLTDIIHIIKNKNLPINALKIKDSDQVIGVNSRQDLAKTNAAIYKKTNNKHLTNGVTIISPETTFIDTTVTIGEDTIIHPFTIIKGNTHIGKKSIIKPFSLIENETIKNEDTFQSNQTTAYLTK